MKPADWVALIFAIVVAIVVLATAATVLVIELRSPDQDTSKGAEAIGRLIGIMVALLAGYIAGRARNGNGH
jgi:hypothetical protein